MSTTTTTTTEATEATITEAEAATITEAVGRVNDSGKTLLDGWLDTWNACEAASNPSAAWSLAEATYRGTDFKQRKSNVNRIRTTHPRMRADGLQARYGVYSVQGVYNAIGAAARAAEATEATEADAMVTDGPTDAERAAIITEAVRLSTLSAEAIAEAVAAGLAARTS